MREGRARPFRGRTGDRERLALADYLRVGTPDASLVAAINVGIARGVWVGTAGRGISEQVIVVIDALGGVSSALASADLGVPILHLRSRRDLAELSHVGLVVVAVYAPPPWRDVESLAANVRTVVIASAGQVDEARAAIASMAFGYLTTALPPDAMRRAIKGALRGQPAYARDTLGRWISDQFASITPELRRAIELTPRQREVVRLVAKGASDKQIARTLGITTGTAQKHVTNLLKRLGAPNRAAAVAQVAVVEFWSARGRVEASSLGVE